MSTIAEQMRAWTGPALLSYGFRPFFLGAALWIPMFGGVPTLQLPPRPEGDRRLCCGRQRCRPSVSTAWRGSAWDW